MRRLPYSVIVTGGLAFVFAAIGLAQSDHFAEMVVWNPLEWKLVEWTELIYFAAGTLAFEVPEFANPESAWLQVSRPFVVLFAASGISSVLATVFRESYDRQAFAVASWFRSPHIVIGLGSIGEPLAKTLRDRRKLVVTVALKKEELNVQEARFRGEHVHIGDATEPDTQNQLPLSRAEELWVATGDDARNLEIAGALLRAAKGWHRTTPLRCYVHLDDPARERALARQGLWQLTEDKIWLRAFSQPELAARELFLGPEGIGGDAMFHPQPAAHEPFHLVVLGFGATGRAVTRHLARFGHFNSELRSRLTVFAKNARAEFETFLQRHPALSPPRLDLTSRAFRQPPGDHAPDAWSTKQGRPIAKRYRVDDGPANVVEYAVNAEALELQGDVQSDAVMAAITHRLRPTSGPRVRGAIVVCFEEDQFSFEAALNLQHALFDQDLDLPETVPIYVYLPTEEGLKDLLAQAKTLSEKNTPDLWKRFPVRAFGLQRDVASYDKLVEPKPAKHADAAQKLYKRLAPERAAETHPDFRESALDAARHAPVKLAAIGLRLTKPYETPPKDARSVLGELLSPGVDRMVWFATLGFRQVSPWWFKLMPRTIQMRLALRNAIRGIDAANTGLATSDLDTLQGLDGKQRRLVRNIKAIQTAILAAADTFENDLAQAGCDQQLMAKIEHNRWMGERLALGWRWGKRSNPRRQREAFVPFEDLPTKDSQHDRVDVVRYLVQEWEHHRAPYFDTRVTTKS